MKSVMGVINLADENQTLRELTALRCLAAVPFGSKYRLIDFVLSNMVNSGIQNIGVFALDKYRSLLEHLGEGSDWDLDRKKDGLFIFPPTLTDLSYVGGDIKNLCANLEYFKRSQQDTVVVSGSSMVCNYDYTTAVDYHLKNNADITFIYKDVSDVSEYPDSTFLELDKEQRVTAIQNSTNKTSAKVYMNMFILSKSLFIELLKMYAQQGKRFFFKEGLQSNFDNFKVMAVPFEGYLAHINSLSTYYNRSFDLLNPLIYKELFINKHAIYTKAKNQPPTKYLSTSQVKNSLLANGCIIEGMIEDSILFRGVRVHEEAYIKNSIIMPHCEIGKGAIVENCILDKKVIISAGEIIKGDKYTVFGRRSFL